jgi:hypothetical protein
MVEGQAKKTKKARAAGAPSESLRVLCLCLSAPQVPEARDELQRLFRGSLDWVGLAAYANAQLVAPAVWLGLERSGLSTGIPEDFRDYLFAIYRANAERMASIHRQACRAFAALDARGVTPLVLKGGARLFEEGPEAGCARMMADLDLLVERASFAAALAALGAIGYELVDEAQGRRAHATSLRRPGEPAAIDLHGDVGRQRDFIPLPAVLADATTMRIDAWQLRIPSPTHRIMHAFFHSQLHDRGHVGGDIPLRHLEDTAWTVARHGTAIDWGAIAQACDRLRLGRAWNAWLYLARRCLAVPVPLPAERWRAWLHYRRCLFQADHERLDSLLRAGLAVTEPFSYVNIDYRYGCGASRSRLSWARLLEMRRLFGKYGLHLPRRLLAAVREDREQALWP